MDDDYGDLDSDGFGRIDFDGDIIGNDPPPGWGGNRTRAWWIVGAGIGAVLLGLAFSLNGGVNPQGGSGSAANSPAPVASSESLAPPPIRIDAARADADAAWYAGGGQTAVVQLTGDSNRIAVEYIQQNYNALGSDCSRLGSDVAAAQAYAPMPDGSAQNAWAVALGHLQLGAQACVYGVSNSLNSQLDAGNDEIRTGTLTLNSLETQLGPAPSFSVPSLPTYGF